MANMSGHVYFEAAKAIHIALCEHYQPKYHPTPHEIYSWVPEVIVLQFHQKKWTSESRPDRNKTWKKGIRTVLKNMSISWWGDQKEGIPSGVGTMWIFGRHKTPGDGNWLHYDVTPTFLRAKSESFAKEVGYDSRTYRQHIREDLKSSGFFPISPKGEQPHV